MDASNKKYFPDISFAGANKKAKFPTKFISKLHIKFNKATTPTQGSAITFSPGYEVVEYPSPIQDLSSHQNLKFNANPKKNQDYTHNFNLSLKPNSAIGADPNHRFNPNSTVPKKNILKLYGPVGTSTLSKNIDPKKDTLSRATRSVSQNSYFNASAHVSYIKSESPNYPSFQGLNPNSVLISIDDQFAHPNANIISSTNTTSVTALNTATTMYPYTPQTHQNPHIQPSTYMKTRPNMQQVHLPPNNITNTAIDSPLVVNSNPEHLNYSYVDIKPRFNTLSYSQSSDSLAITRHESPDPNQDEYQDQNTSLNKKYFESSGDNISNSTNNNSNTNTRRNIIRNPSSKLDFNINTASDSSEYKSHFSPYYEDFPVKAEKSHISEMPPPGLPNNPTKTFPFPFDQPNVNTDIKYNQKSSKNQKLVINTLNLPYYKQSEQTPSPRVVQQDIRPANFKRSSGRLKNFPVVQRDQTLINHSNHLYDYPNLQHRLAEYSFLYPEDPLVEVGDDDNDSAFFNRANLLEISSANDPRDNENSPSAPYNPSFPKGSNKGSKKNNRSKRIIYGAVCETVEKNQNSIPKSNIEVNTIIPIPSDGPNRYSKTPEPKHSASTGKSLEKRSFSANPNSRPGTRSSTRTSNSSNSTSSQKCSKFYASSAIGAKPPPLFSTKHSKSSSCDIRSSTADRNRTFTHSAGHESKEFSYPTRSYAKTTASNKYRSSPKVREFTQELEGPFKTKDTTPTHENAYLYSTLTTVKPVNQTYSPHKHSNNTSEISATGPTEPSPVSAQSYKKENYHNHPGFQRFSEDLDPYPFSNFSQIDNICNSVLNSDSSINTTHSSLNQDDVLENSNPNYSQIPNLGRNPKKTPRNLPGTPHSPPSKYTSKQEFLWYNNMESSRKNQLQENLSLIYGQLSAETNKNKNSAQNVSVQESGKNDTSFDRTMRKSQTLIIPTTPTPTPKSKLQYISELQTHYEMHLDQEVDQELEVELVQKRYRAPVDRSSMQRASTVKPTAEVDILHDNNSSATRYPKIKPHKSLGNLSQNTSRPNVYAKFNLGNFLQRIKGNSSIPNLHVPNDQIETRKAQAKPSNNSLIIQTKFTSPVETNKPEIPSPGKGLNIRLTSPIRKLILNKKSQRNINEILHSPLPSFNLNQENDKIPSLVKTNAVTPTAVVHAANENISPSSKYKDTAITTDIPKFTLKEKFNRPKSKSDITHVRYISSSPLLRSDRYTDTPKQNAYVPIYSYSPNRTKKISSNGFPNLLEKFPSIENLNQPVKLTASKSHSTARLTVVGSMRVNQDGFFEFCHFLFKSPTKKESILDTLYNPYNILNTNSELGLAPSYLSHKIPSYGISRHESISYLFECFDKTVQIVKRKQKINNTLPRPTITKIPEKTPIYRINTFLRLEHSARLQLLTKIDINGAGKPLFQTYNHPDISMCLLVRGDWVKSAPNLASLALVNIGLTQVPFNINSVPHLKHLNISANWINSISETLSNMNLLSYLNVSDNPLSLDCLYTISRRCTRAKVYFGKYLDSDLFSAFIRYGKSTIIKPKKYSSGEFTEFNKQNHNKNHPNPTFANTLSYKESSVAGFFGSGALNLFEDKLNLFGNRDSNNIICQDLCQNKQPEDSERLKSLLIKRFKATLKKRSESFIQNAESLTYDNLQLSIESNAAISKIYMQLMFNTQTNFQHVLQIMESKSFTRFASNKPNLIFSKLKPSRRLNTVGSMHRGSNSDSTAYSLSY